jgi:hypothetical protein
MSKEQCSVRMGCTKAVHHASVSSETEFNPHLTFSGGSLRIRLDSFNPIWKYLRGTFAEIIMLC